MTCQFKLSYVLVASVQQPSATADTNTVFASQQAAAAAAVGVAPLDSSSSLQDDPLSVKIQVLGSSQLERPCLRVRMEVIDGPELPQIAPSASSATTAAEGSAEMVVAALAALGLGHQQQPDVMLHQSCDAQQLLSLDLELLPADAVEPSAPPPELLKVHLRPLHQQQVPQVPATTSAGAAEGGLVDAAPGQECGGPRVKLHIIPEVEQAGQGQQEQVAPDTQQLVRLVLTVKGQKAGLVHPQQPLPQANALLQLLQRSAGTARPPSAASSTAAVDHASHPQQAQLMSSGLVMAGGSTSGPVLSGGTLGGAAGLGPAGLLPGPGVPPTSGGLLQLGQQQDSNYLVSSHSHRMLQQQQAVRQGLIGLGEPHTLQPGGVRVQGSPRSSTPSWRSPMPRPTAGMGVATAVVAGPAAAAPAAAVIRPTTQGAGQRPRPQFQQGFFDPQPSFAALPHHTPQASGYQMQQNRVRPGTSAGYQQQAAFAVAGGQQGHLQVAGQVPKSAGQFQLVPTSGPVVGVQHQLQMRQPQLSAAQQPQQVMSAPAGYMVVQQQQQQHVVQQQEVMQYGVPPGSQQMVMMPVQMKQGGVITPGNAVGIVSNPSGATNGMMLYTTADGRQVLVQDPQQQTPHHQQMQLIQQQKEQYQHLAAAPQQQQPVAHVNPGVFVMGPNGELVPAGSQPQQNIISATQHIMLQQHQQQQPQQHQQHQQQLLAQQQAMQQQQRQKELQQQEFLQQQQQQQLLQQQQQLQQQQLLQQTKTAVVIVASPPVPITFQ